MPEQNTSADFHHAFYSALIFHFASKGINLEYIQEHELGEKPVRIDFIIIKKAPLLKIDDPLGQFFKSVNIIEYKSPDDGLTIDDFFKVIAYGLLYKVIDRKVDELPINDMTFTLVRETYPREMIKALKKYGYSVEKVKAGIYIIEGKTPVPVLLVVGSQLPEEDYTSLRMLKRSVTEREFKKFLEEIQEIEDANTREHAFTVMDFCLDLNKALKEMEEKGMFKNIQEFFGVDYDTDRQNAIKEAVEKTTEQTNERVAADMLRDGKPLDEIKKYSRLAENAIYSLASKLGIAVV